MSKRRLKVKVDRKKGVFLEAFMAAEKPISEAATRAVREAADEAKTGARANIASAGFSKRWQNALRVDVYPRGSDPSINAAAHIYHKIGYAGVFEEGARIAGSRYLWVPLPTAPAKIGRMRTTPKRYMDLVGTLQFIRRPGKPPLLAATVGMSPAMAGRNRVKRLSMSTLRRGYTGKSKTRVLRSVPLFVGISAVQIRKRFHITRIVRKAAARLPDLYLKHFREN